jgi:hypothetical protein
VKLSVFKKANFTPKTKEDKIKLAYLCSKDNLPETTVVRTDEELIEAITTYSWSPFVFDGPRHEDFWVSCDFLVLDIDTGLSIAESERRIQNLGLMAVCLPSPSFTQENQKHRLVFPLLHTIFNKADYFKTLEKMCEHFPERDPSCSDLARWYCMSNLSDGFFQEGELLKPTRAEIIPNKSTANLLKGELIQVDVTDGIRGLVRTLYGKDRERVPESVSFFLENAHTGIEGNWIMSLNAAVFSLALSGIEEDVIISVIESIAPNPLDSKDMYQIKKAVRDGKNSSENL